MKSLRFILALACASLLAASFSYAGNDKETPKDQPPAKVCDCGKDKDGKECGKDKDCCCTGKKASCEKETEKPAASKK